MSDQKHLYSELAATGPYEAKIGSALITMVEPHVGHEYSYNRWYEDDHFNSGAMAMPWMFSFSTTCSSRLVCKTPATFPWPKHVVHIRFQDLRSAGLPRQRTESRMLVLPVRGRSNSYPALHPQPVTKRAEAIRPRIPILTTCCAAPCRTPRRGAWVA